MTTHTVVHIERSVSFIFLFVLSVCNNNTSRDNLGHLCLLNVDVTHVLDCTRTLIDRVGVKGGKLGNPLFLPFGAHVHIH